MPDQTSTDHRVVNFREAATSRARDARDEAHPAEHRSRPSAQQSPVAGLVKFEQAPEQDDYRHRMITNGLALIFIVLLVIAGVWIADTMAAMRKNQDCVLSGRRGCTPVEAPVLQRW